MTNSIQSTFSRLTQYLQFQCFPINVNDLLAEFEIPICCADYFKGILSNLDYCNLQDGMITVEENCLRENICKSTRFFEMSDQKWLVLKQIVNSKTTGIYQHDIANIIKMNNKTVFFQVKSLLSEGIIVKEQRAVERRPALWLIHKAFYKPSTQQDIVISSSTTKDKLLEIRLQYKDKFNSQKIGNNEARKMICSVLKVVDNNSIIVNDLLYVLYGQAYDDGLCGKDRRYCNRLILQLIDDGYCKTFLDQNKHRCVKLLRDYLDPVAQSRAFLPLHLKDKKAETIHYSQYLLNTIEELILSKCLENGVSGVTSTDLVNYFLLSPKTLDRYLYKLVGAGKTYPNSLQILKTVVNSGKSRLATYFHPSVIDQLSREYVVSRSYAKPSVKTVFTKINGSNFSGFVKPRDLKRLYSSKYVKAPNEIEEITDIPKKRSAASKSNKRKKTSCESDSISTESAEESFKDSPAPKSQNDLSSPKMHDMMDVDDSIHPSIEVNSFLSLDDALDVALDDSKCKSINTPNLDEIIKSQYEVRQESFTTLEVNDKKLSADSYRRKMFIYLIVMECKVLEFNKQIIEFVNHKLLDNKVKKMDKKTINGDVEWLKNKKLINCDTIMLPKLTGGLLSRKVLYEPGVSTSDAIFRSFVSSCERNYYNTSKKLLPMPVESIHVDSVFNLEDDDANSSSSSLKIACSLGFITSKFKRSRFFHALILKYATSSTISIVSIIKSLSIGEYIQIIPFMDNTASVVEFINNNKTVNIMNSEFQSMNNKRATQYKLKYHLRTICNILTALSILTPINKSYEWHLMKQQDHADVEYFVESNVPLYTYNMTSMTRTLVEHVNISNNVDQYWDLLEMQSKSSLLTQKTSNSNSNSAHPLQFINNRRSWALKVELTPEQKEQLQEYCTLNTTPYHNNEKLVQISESLDLPLDKIKQYYRFLESDYLQCKIQSRLHVKSKNSNFQTTIKRKPRVRRKISFSNEDYLNLIIMVLLIKHLYKQVSWYFIAQQINQERSFGDVLRRQYTMLSNKPLAKIVMSKIKLLIEQTTISVKDVPLLSFPLQEYANVVKEKISIAIKNELQIALTPTTGSARVVESGQGLYLSDYIPDSSESFNNNDSMVQKSRYLLRAFLQSNQTINIYQYCIQHHINADVLDRAINLEIENRSVINRDNIKLSPQYMNIFEANMNYKQMNLYEDYEFDLQRISASGNYYIINGMISGKLELKMTVTTKVPLMPKKTRNTLDLVPKLELIRLDNSDCCKDTEKDSLEASNSDNKLYQHLTVQGQHELFYRASVSVYTIIKNNPSITRLALTSRTKIGLSLVELDKIINYLVAIRWIREEKITLSKKTIFGPETKVEEHYFNVKDAYLRVPMKMREFL